MNKRGNINYVMYLLETCMFSQEGIWYEKWMISFSLVSLFICASSQREQTLERHQIQKEHSIESSYINPKLYLRNGTYASHPISVSQAPNASSSIFIQPDDYPCAERDFSNIPIAKTVSESKEFLEARIKRIVKCGVEKPLT